MATKPTDSAEDNPIPYDMLTFRDWAHRIQQQLDQMSEKISNAIAMAQAASMRAAYCSWKIPNPEQEHEKAPSAPALPDSNGFWRDKDGDIWAYDGDEDNIPVLLFDPRCSKVWNLSMNKPYSWSIVNYYAPFTKIDNPFTTGNNHANR